MLLLALACTISPGGPTADHELEGSKPGSSPTAPPGSHDTGSESSPSDDDPPDPSAPSDTSTPPVVTDLYRDCFSSFMDSSYPLPDYDAASATIGTHCSGTNHQDIHNIERVVFIGDSVTLGTPPANSSDWYRNRLAQTLSTRFGLQAPGWNWQNVDILAGDPLERFDGDFGVCAWWGARTDDLLLSEQLPDCLPEADRHLRTLVVITAGGNDVFKQIQARMEGASEAEIETATVEWVQLMEDALVWLKEPGRFPNGVDVIFANVYDYTDGDGDLSACPGADFFGFGAVDTTHIDGLTQWAMGEYLRMATETETDMLFIREGFCGHGFNASGAAGRCDRGGDDALWFDETCIHPNAAGHGAIADMVLNVIDE